VDQGKEGSGLGLCIARSIAEAHSGRVSVESSPGQGSSFTAFLPLNP
jgi:signal transduction histidine kinase